MQLINTLPCTWKRNLLQNRGNPSNLCVYDNCLSKNSQICAVNKFNRKEIYAQSKI